MLTNAAAKAAGAQARAYKLHDQGGLFLLVRPTGTKSWQQKYRWRGREKLLTLGQFPDILVPRARILQAEAKEQLERGIDPSAAAAKADTFEPLARAWHRHHRASWSTAHAGDVIASLERDVFPEIGARPIAAIAPRELLAVLQKIEHRGCLETAGRLRQRLEAIFGFAIANDQADRNPATELGRAMVKGKLSKPHAALTNVSDCRALLAASELHKARPMTVLAHRFLALTAVRLAAVLGARWEEINFEARTWTVPAERMKLSRAKKGEARFDHVVPLCDAAIAVLEAARELGVNHRLDGGEPHAGGLIFPGRGGNSPIGEGTLRELIVAAGFGGRHVPHGWRASFSTILNEELGEEWRRDIDRALAHASTGKVEAAYNRAVLLDRRRALFDRWGELLTNI